MLPYTYMKREQLRGKVGFERYYRQWFTSDEEYAIFLENLSKERLPVLLFAPEDALWLQTEWRKMGLPYKTISWFPNAIYWPEGVEKGTILPGYQEKKIYAMNQSSLLPVKALGIHGDEMILDACAAPGGKLLAISSLLQSGKVIANERSFSRRERLKHTLQEYQRDIDVLGRGAETLFKTHAGEFDLILLDAPCSSERHVWTSPKYLNTWSDYRIRQLKQMQISLISGLLLCLKMGGRLVYSTCAITPEENEMVIAQIVHKKKDKVRLIDWLGSEETPGATGMSVVQAEIAENVCRVWPEGDNDPMFVAVLERTG